MLCCLTKIADVLCDPVTVFCRIPVLIDDVLTICVDKSQSEDPASDVTSDTYLTNRLVWIDVDKLPFKVAVLVAFLLKQWCFNAIAEEYLDCCQSTAVFKALVSDLNRSDQFSILRLFNEFIFGWVFKVPFKVVSAKIK